jgi:TetR/AcrR family transcriptional regulator, transcriptional repressor for nem operon
MRYSPEHKQKTRERVLKVAARAIRAEGPHRIGVAGVMNKAGLTHGGFYAHFASKDAMISAAIEHMFAEVHARSVENLRECPGAEGLSVYIDHYLSARHRDSRTAGCPIAALTADVPRLSPMCRASFAAGTRRLRDGLAERLNGLGFEDPDVLASSVMAELVGALSISRGEPDRTRSDAMLDASRRLLKQRLGLEENA